jgi:hypothetical protein
LNNISIDYKHNQSQPFSSLFTTSTVSTSSTDPKDVPRRLSFSDQGGLSTDNQQQQQQSTQPQHHSLASSVFIQGESEHKPVNFFLSTCC